MTSLLTLPQSNGSSPSVRARAFVCEDPQSRELLTRIEHLAPSDGAVLIVGETGTGKEILARHIHRLSRRAHRPFVALNCLPQIERIRKGRIATLRGGRDDLHHPPSGPGPAPWDLLARQLGGQAHDRFRLLRLSGRRQ